MNTINGKKMKPQVHVPQLFTLEQIAERFEVSVKTVRRWVGAGELPAHYLGRQVRITEQDARAFVMARRR